MSLISSQALADLVSDSSEPECVPPPSAKSSLTVVASSPSTGLASLVTVTSESSPQTNSLPMESTSMCYAEDSPAWRPIETAPIQPFNKDRWYMAHSDYLLVWNGSSCQIASYHYTKNGKGKWHINGRIAEVVIYWMPLPKGPT